MGLFDLLGFAGDVIGYNAVWGALTGENDGSLGADIGISLRKKVTDFFTEVNGNEGHSITIAEWTTGFNSNPNADHVYYRVKQLSREESDGEIDGQINAMIISKSGETIASEYFYAPFHEAKEMHKQKQPFPVSWNDKIEEESDDSTESKADSPSPVPKIEDKTAPKQELSVEERLAKLKKLFEDGILEEDEYREKRKELIALL